MSTENRLESSLEPRELPDPSRSVELARRAQRGDAEALNELLLRYQDRLRRIVRIRLGAHLRQRLESMDIVQDAYGVAFQKIGNLELRSTASILQWLAGIAVNKIRDAHDHHFADKRTPGRELPLSSGSLASGSTPAASEHPELPEERVWRQELRELLDDAMTRLPADHREVILLRDYSAGSWDFVAHEMGRVSVPAAQELHRRAWIKLRALLRPKLRGLVE